MAARAAAAVLGLLALLTGPAAALPAGPTAAASQGATLNAQGQPLLTPTNFTSLGRSSYYEIPQRPIGVLVMFHGQ